jgi:hypothetical protein
VTSTLAKARTTWKRSAACIVVLAYLFALPKQLMLKLAVGDLAPDGDRVRVGGCRPTVRSQLQAPLRAQVPSNPATPPPPTGNAR